MIKNLCLVGLVGLVGLSSCQRQMVGGFQASHTESFAPKTTTKPNAPVAAPNGVEAISFTRETAAEPVEALAPQPVTSESVALVPTATPASAAPASINQVADRLVASAKGTRYEARTLKIKAALEKATAQNQLNAAPRKMTLAEKAMTKLVTKKVNKQLAKAQRPDATKAVDSFIVIGIVLLAVGLIFALIPGTGIVGAIAAIAGVVFLIIGLLNQMG